MENRVNLSKASPELYKIVVGFDQAAGEFATKSGIATGFAHLLTLRASQLNHCAFCVRLHTKDALASGESTERISVLPAWRETEYFNPKERASLALCEAVTFVAEGQVSEEVYAAAEAVLSHEEIAAVEWLSIVINTWNRIGISSRYPVKP